MIRIIALFCSLSLNLFAEIYLHVEAGDGQAFFVGEEIPLYAYNAWDDRELTFTWDFGDQRSGTGSAVVHTYSDPGQYLLSITGVANDGEESPPFKIFLFIMPLEAELNPIVSFEPTDLPHIVLKGGESIVFQATSMQENMRFHWHLLGTDLYHEGVNWEFAVPVEWGQYESNIQLTGLLPDGSASRYPEIREIYIYETNHPPDANVLTPEMERVDDVKLFQMNLGGSQLFTGHVEDPDGPQPLSFFWYSLDTEEYIEGPSFLFNATEEGFFSFALSAIDGYEEADPFPDYFDIRVRGDNQAPFAWINNPSETTGINEILTFQAEGYDPEEDPITFHWTLGDGRSASGPEINISYDRPGVYRLGLTAEDFLGAITPQAFEIWVFVNDYLANMTNQNPYPTLLSPQFGDMFPVNQVIEFEAFGYDPDQTSDLGYFWDFGDGTIAEGTRFQQRSFSFSGDTWVGVFVQDQEGFVSHYGDYVQIAFYEGERPPNAMIVSPEIQIDFPGEYSYQAAPGSVIQFSGEVEGVTDVSSYNAIWTLEGEVVATGFNPDPMQVPEPGFYYVQLDIQGPNGDWDPIPPSFTLWVRDSNTPPMVWIEEPGWDKPVHVSEVMSLSAYYEDEEEDPVSFFWQFSDGRSFTGDRIDEVSFYVPGLYWIDLTGTDSEDAVNVNQARRYITVFPDIDWDVQEPPEISRVNPVDEYFIGPRNSQYQFSASASDFFGEAIREWRWDFGNGDVSGEMIPDPVQFQKTGTYEVRVFAKDASNLWSPFPASWLVGIYGDNIPPDGQILTPELVEAEDSFNARLIHIPLGTVLTMTGEAHDPDGDFPLEVTWLLDSNLLGHTLDISPISFNELGYFYLEFLVTDSKGEYDPIPDYRVIHVIDPELKPVAFIGYPDTDLTVEPGEELWFYGYGEDPNELDLTYEWDFGPNGNPATAVGTDIFPVVFAQETPENEPVTVTLVAKNGYASSEPVSVRIKVKQYRDEDFEPNDNFDQAFNIELGSYSQLSLGGSDQADYFLFEVREDSKNFRLQLQTELNDDGFQLSLFLQEGDNWTPYPIHNDLNEATTIVLQDMQEGTYALEVTHNLVGKIPTDGINYGIGITTEQPVLYIPFLVEDGNLSSEFGIINVQPEVAEISISGIDGKGETIVRKSITLNPGEKFYEPALSFFGVSKSVEQAKLIKWIRVHSANRLIGFSNSQSKDGTQLMSAGAFKSLNSSIIIPHIAQQTQQWYTRAVVINASEKSFGLDFVDSSRHTGLGDFKANNQEDVRFTDLFSGSLPAWGRFTQGNGEAALAGVEIFGRRDGFQQVAALEMAPEKIENPNFTFIRNDLYFTHVAKDTANFWTGITLVNTQEIGQTCRIKAYSDAGVVLATLDHQLEANAKLLTTVANLFPGVAEISWLQVEADRGISGFVLFGDHQNKRLAGFPAAGYLTDFLVFPHVKTSTKAWTGLAVLNIGDSSVTANFKGFSKKGVLLLETNVVMASKTKKVATVPNLFSGQTIPENLAYITVTTPTKSINGFELFGSLDGGILGATMAGLSAQTE